MKKLSLLVAIAAFGHAAFAGTPKTIENEKTAVEAAAPNDDPAPVTPATTVTYYLAQWYGSAPTGDKKDFIESSIPNSYTNYNLVNPLNTPYGWIIFPSSTCRAEFLAQSIGDGSSDKWSTYYKIDLTHNTVTTTPAFWVISCGSVPPTN